MMLVDMARGRTWVYLATGLLVTGVVAAVLVIDRGSDPPPATPAGAAATARDPKALGVVATGSAFLTPEEAASHDDGPTSRLEGQVIDEQQQPIAGATVRLAPGNRMATSQADGSFVFDGVAFRTYSVAATLGEQFAPNVRVRFTESSEPVTLRMRRGVTLVVHVVGHGSAVADADIVVDDARTERTGSDGTARVAGLAPRFHSVEAHAPGYARTRDHVQLPDDPGAAVERTLELRAGAALGGTVVDPAGKPLADAQVEIAAGGTDAPEQATTDAHGVWRVDAIAAGHYALTATSKTYGPAEPLRIELDGTTPRTDVELRLAYDAQLVGTVVDRDGQPVAHATVVVTASGTADYDEPTDEHGHFEMLGILAARDYRIFARKGGDASEVTHLELGNDRRTEVRLQLAHTAIAGTVVDARGEPIAEANVRAAPTAMRAFAIGATDNTDSRGHFVLEGLEPGDYRLVATWPDQDVRRLGGSGEVYPTGTSDVKIVLPPPAALIGRALLDGKPVPYYGVLVSEHPEFAFIGDPVSVRSADGTFAIHSVQPGTWGVIVLGPGTARQVITDVHVADGKTTDLGDIVLARGAKISGHVTDTSGAPVVGARVQIGLALRGMPDRGTLAAAFAGSYTTTTDASGAYVFDGVALGEHESISATAPGRGMAPPLPLPAGDSTIDLTLAASGGIDGTLVNYTSGYVGVHARSTVPGMSRISLDAVLDASGGFHFDDVPAGDYSIGMFAPPGSPSAPSVQATVVANQRITVTLVLPKATVDIAVHVTGADCDLFLLARPGEGSGMPGPDSFVQIAKCNKGVAEISAIAPGPYRGCSSQKCAPLTVAEAPPKQTIELALPP